MWKRAGRRRTHTFYCLATNHSRGRLPVRKKNRGGVEDFAGEFIEGRGPTTYGSGGRRRHARMDWPASILQPLPKNIYSQVRYEGFLFCRSAAADKLRTAGHGNIRLTSKNCINRLPPKNWIPPHPAVCAEIPLRRLGIRTTIKRSVGLSSKVTYAGISWPNTLNPRGEKSRARILLAQFLFCDQGGALRINM